MATLKKGSKGEEVLQLQNMLNNWGNYGLDTDGIFGDKTYGAVTDFQTKNNLGVDGIVGEQTWSALNAMGNAANSTNPDGTQTPDMQTTAAGNSYDANQMSGAQADLNAAEAGRPRFGQSQALTDAMNELQAARQNRPGEYVSPFAGQIEELYNQVMGGRQPFQYDPNADPLYQLYRDRYAQNARQSMQDTLADAASLTGGYGNSYAQAAAQQAYDAQMNGLNDVLPELYNQAYGRYQAEGDELLQRLALAQQMDQTEYGRYQDALADYYNNLSAALNLADSQYAREYGEYQDALNQFNADRAYYYGITQDELAQQNYLNQLMMSGSSGGGSSGGRSSGGGSSSGSKKTGGSSSGGSTGANYKTVLNTAKGMTDADAYAYVTRMADGGYISNEEGYRILAVEKGIDLSKFAGGIDSNDVGALAGQLSARSGTQKVGGASALARQSSGTSGTSSGASGVGKANSAQTSQLAALAALAAMGSTSARDKLKK